MSKLFFTYFGCSPYSLPEFFKKILLNCQEFLKKDIFVKFRIFQIILCLLCLCFHFSLKRKHISRYAFFRFFSWSPYTELRLSKHYLEEWQRHCGFVYLISSPKDGFEYYQGSDVEGWTINMFCSEPSLLLYCE